MARKCMDCPEKETENIDLEQVEVKGREEILFSEALSLGRSKKRLRKLKSKSKLSQVKTMRQNL